MTKTLVAALARRDSPTIRAASVTLSTDGWATVSDDDELVALRVASSAYGPLDAFILDLSLHDGRSVAELSQVPHRLIQAAAVAAPLMRGKGEGGGAIVVVTSRDTLGAGDRPEIAAAAGALVSAARSLALHYAEFGVTVNVVAGPPSVVDAPPVLLPDPVTASDVAEAVAFFADPRSRYITGQLMFVCGGSSLLSSLSV